MGEIKMNRGAIGETQTSSESVGSRRVLIWVIVGLAAALLLAGLILVALTPPIAPPLLGASDWQAFLLVSAFSLYALVGGLIVVRRPRNRVGLVFLATGVLLSIWVLTAGYASYGLLAQPGSLPGARFAGWVFSWIVVPVFALTFVFLPTLFPDGRFGSRWRQLVGWYGLAATLFTAFTWATDPEPGLPFDAVLYPIEAVAQLRLPEWGWGSLVIAVLAAVISIVIRYRRSSGAERRQLQWFAFGVILVGLVFVTATIGSQWQPAAGVADVTFPFAVAGLPVAAFVAIFRFDLYDLDLVVSKTLTAGVLTVLIGGLYVAVVAGIGSLAGWVGESSVALAVVATAVVAVVFAPLRTWAHRVARRFVYGERADPYEVLAEFAHRIGSAPDPADALGEISRLVQAGTGAEQAEVWLVVGDELRLMATATSRIHRVPIPIQRESLPEIPEATHVVEVASQDRLLGAVSWTLPSGQSSSPTEQRLVGDLAAQAALVFQNLGLIEELKDSRQRIVEAQDLERRRLERDLHDGVQQRLLALAVALGSDAGQAHPGSSSGAADEARAILAELRRLARGIHPAIVAEGGLHAALESLAERSAIPVNLDVTELELSASAEITMYYLAAEGLTNAVRHSGATNVDISVRAAGRDVEVTVVDDGVGGADPSGSGLIGLADRVAAAGGHMVVDSPVARGTRLTAVLPCE